MKQSAENLLNNLGWSINYAGDGKIFTTWKGKKVTEKKYKYILEKDGIRYIGCTLESFVVNFIKMGVIASNQIQELGYKVCGRCGGKGIHDSYRYVAAGICFKCSGEGILYK